MNKDFFENVDMVSFLKGRLYELDCIEECLRIYEGEDAESVREDTLNHIKRSHAYYMMKIRRIEQEGKK